LLRILFYSVLALFPILSGLTALSLLASSSAWAAYFLLSFLRLLDVVKKRPFFFAVRALGWMLPALPAMDAAKTTGFIVGSLERLLIPKYRRAR
jgi:hypothetical protein